MSSSEAPASAANGGTSPVHPRSAAAGSSEKNLTRRAYEAIRDGVITCQLAPGETISERMLADRFGFGKAPVRLALARLAQEGLINVQPRRGHQVAPLTLRDIHELFDLRAILEPAAARLAAGRITRAELEALNEPWRAGYERDEVDSTYLKANKAFHAAIAVASGNSRLADSIIQLLDETDRLIYLGLPLASEREEIQLGHQPLIDALADGDAAAAERLAYEHVSAAKQTRIDTLIAGSSLLETNIEPAS